MWAVVGRQEMLQRKRQKSTPSHGRKEKAETVNGPCFMVLLTLKEQVEWNMYNTGQVSVLLQCRSWIILPQASHSQTDAGQRMGCLSDGLTLIFCCFFVFVLSPFAFWPWKCCLFLHTGTTSHWSASNSCKYWNYVYDLNNCRYIWTSSIQVWRALFWKCIVQLWIYLKGT